MSVESRYNLSEIQWPKTPFSLFNSVVMLVKRGSEAHGTYCPPEEANGIDDRDIMGLVIPPIDYYVGLKDDWKKSEVQEINGPWDVVLYDVRKFMRLVVAQNPNILTALWSEKEDYLKLTPFGHILIRERDMFRGREKFHSACIGYANAQLKKMTSFSLGTGYMGKKRKQLVEKYGFDCKNSAHLIRLLRMGKEFHLEGVLHVRRTHDKEELIDIKHGKWSLQRIEEEAARCFEEAEAAYQSSILPEAVNMEAINNLLVREMKGWFLETVCGMRRHPEKESAWIL